MQCELCGGEGRPSHVRGGGYFHVSFDIVACDDCNERVVQSHFACYKRRHVEAILARDQEAIAKFRSGFLRRPGLAERLGLANETVDDLTRCELCDQRITLECHGKQFCGERCRDLALEAQ